MFDHPFRVGPCQGAADFRAILDNGINTDGAYLEVQMPNVLDPQCQPAFEEAHRHLQAYLDRHEHPQPTPATR